VANGSLAVNPPWLARVETPEGNVLGAGFLVDDDTVLTCAHVVGPPDAREPARVAVCFVHSDSAQPVPGQVASGDYHPLASPDDSVDLAVVRLAGPTPPGAGLAPLADPPSLAGHRLVLKGFPAGREWGDTVRALAVAEGGPRAGWWELHGESGRTGSWVDKGFSGGPVWSDTVEAVVAMTVARWPSVEEREAYAIPLATVIDAYPALGLRVSPTLDDRRAEDRLRRDLATLVQRHGSTDARSVSTRYGLAILLLQQGAALAEAERLLRQCLADVDAGQHPARRKIGMWWTLGETLSEQWRHDEALDCIDTALRLAVEYAGPDDPRQAALLARRGLLLGQLGRVAEAGAALQRADELGGSAHGSELAGILFARATVAAATDLNEAERLAQECYDLTREASGADHPAVVRPACLLGGILIGQQSFARGRRLLEEALAVAEARYPTNHPQVADCLAAVARIELTEGKPESALHTCSRALHKAEAAFGADHVRTAPYLIQMAYARQTMGDPTEALRLADRVVRIVEQALPAGNLGLVSPLYTRAEMRAGHNDFAGALSDAERSLEITVRAYGWVAPMAAQPAALVAYLLVFNGRPEEAERLARRTLGLVEGSRLPTQPLIASCHTTLAQVAVQQGRLDDAETEYREVIRLLESVQGSGHPLVGMRHVELGVVQRRRLHFQEAERSIRRGLDILTRTLPPDHPSVVNARKLSGPVTRLRRLMNRLGE